MKEILFLGSMYFDTMKSILKNKSLTITDNMAEVDNLMKDNGIDFSNQTPITSPYKDFSSISTYGSGKEFVCKGRHQYVEFNGEWVCKCGRKSTD